MGGYNFHGKWATWKYRQDHEKDDSFSSEKKKKRNTTRSWHKCERKQTVCGSTHVMTKSMINNRTGAWITDVNQVAQSTWLDIGLVLFSVFMDLDSVSINKHTHQKKKRGQYPAISTDMLSQKPIYSVRELDKLRLWTDVVVSSEKLLLILLSFSLNSSNSLKVTR